MTIQFTKAKHQDAMTIARLRRAIRQAADQGVDPDGPLERYDMAAHQKKNWARIQNPDISTFVIRDGAVPVGYFSFRHTPDVHLLSLYIKQEKQKSGIGRAVFDRLRAHCRSRETVEFTGSCSVFNFPAQAFYEHMGGVITRAEIGHANRRKNQLTYTFDA